ncbi:hypothetical protein KO498_07555 [Lentibacter algarum]|uniref:hypothetical protein n=1 Tax=Lentibacter algarum TaxID=576131 RepID=UPI001C0710CF|nr:hypothetical protein [Lentibacter algarum]MBU2981670.1 hypothetical protein [Lentibacter algarum]
MRIAAYIIAGCLALATPAAAQGGAQEEAATATQPATAAWQTRVEGSQHIAAASNRGGQTAIVNFSKDSKNATLFVTGLWKTRPLDLRLWVAYPGNKRSYIDTYRFAKIVEHDGKFAYLLEIPPSQLRPLRGGEMLVIEDLNHRAQIPLSGSSKAITAAQQSAAAS